MTPLFDELTPSSDGLVTAVIQDAADGTVLMVGFMDEEAYTLTNDTGFVHFWSRSRRTLWKKGETSGNTLTVTSIAADCDHDALLIGVAPRGPTCHTGSRSCFGLRRTSLGSVVDQLVGVVDERRGADPDVSYTATLLTDGDLAARKVLEEAGELAFAVKDLASGAGSEQRVVEEAADVVYHLVALLASSGVAADAVAEELHERRR